MGRKNAPQRWPLVGPSCKGCVYVGHLCSQSAHLGKPDFCNYLCSTGSRRPCPAGPGCTVKRTQRKCRRGTGD